MRLSLVVACLSVCFAGVSLDNDAHASIRKETDIPAEGLGLALNALARKRNVQIIYISEEIANVHTGGAIGEFTTNEALNRLLVGTGLTFGYLDDKTITVGSASASHDRRSRVQTMATRSDDSKANPEGTKNPSGEFLMAQSDQGKDSRASFTESASSGGNTDGSSSGLEEIVVTAQKRSEKLMDVPSSIGVVSGDRLESLQSNSLTDFAGYVSGLTVAAGGSPGQNMVVIRGLSTGYNNLASGPLVATYIGDVPVSSSTYAARGGQIGFDLNPYDVDRIEVLRGPQGTLYGAGAMGGLIKYALRQPDLSQFDAQVGGDVEDISGSGDASWGGRASANLPILTDTLGIRVSGFHDNNAGYIDNVGIDTRHANSSTESGGRVAILWRPVESLSVEGNVLAQDIRSADQAAVTLDATTDRPVYGPQARSTAFPEPFTEHLRNYSLNLDWDLRFATLTNSSSYSTLGSDAQADFSPTFGPFVPYPGGGLVKLDYGDNVSKFTEELRLTSPQHQTIQWMVGGFYTKEDGEETRSVPVFTPTYVPLPMSDNFQTYDKSTTYRERAIFGNGTYQINDRFDLGSGVRYAQNTEIDCVPVNGGFFGSGPLPCASRPYVGVATWMANARFHLDQNSMFYVRWATGYRAGGCNIGCVTDNKLQEPGTFGSDKIANYEGGFKGEFLDHRLRLDLSAFHIDWRDIQVAVINSLGLGYTANGRTATSNGIELTPSLQVTDSLLLQATMDYTNAHLTQDAPNLYAIGVGGKNGDQLPESPRWSGSLSAEYRRPFAERQQLLLGGGYRYRDTVVSQFAGSGEPLPIGPQNIVDLYAGVMLNHVTARLYAKNVFDNRSYMGLLNITNPKMPMFVPVQPRTIGISLDYQFK